MDGGKKSSKGKAKDFEDVFTTPHHVDPSHLSVQEKVRRFSYSDVPSSTSVKITTMSFALESSRNILDSAQKDMEKELAASPMDIEQVLFNLEYYNLQYKKYNDAVVKQLEVYTKDKKESEYQTLDEEAAGHCKKKMEFAHKCLPFLKTTLASTSAGPRATAVSSDSSIKLLLPKRELPQFTGEVREWLPFSASFKEIDNDTTLSDIDKFHYLIQSTKEGSAARKLLQSYPFSATNYEHALKNLEDRYGRNNVLIKVYVRDLLQLVIEASTGKKVDFTDLVTNIISQIRNLSSLGVTQDKCAQVLYPVVESCLPTEVLQAWQRSITFKEELESLIIFLEAEVNSHTERALAHFNIGESSAKGNGGNRPKTNKGNGNSKPPKTATGFLNASGQNEKPVVCTFCEKQFHSATECRQAVKWDLQKRKEILKDRKACFNCFKTSHGTTKCKTKMFCMKCAESHHLLMCENGNTPAKVKTEDDELKGEKSRGQDSSSSSSPSLSNLVSRPEVLLQTLTVWVHGPKGTRRARAAYDSLSQSSYIKEEIASKLDLPLVGHERVAHQTFGGNVTQVQKHNIYQLKVSGLNEKKQYELEISGISKISGAIDRLPPGDYIQECINRGIMLTDNEITSEEIEVLIGADFGDDFKLGGEFVKLQTGPVAVHTKIGWVLSGRLTNTIKRRGKLAMLHLNAALTEKDVSKLWELETIGIQDPAETKSRGQIEQEAVNHFSSTVSQDESGRYTVHLPWIEGHLPLPDNRAVATKRLQTMTKKLKQSGLLENYNKVFQSWLNEGIIQIPGPPHNPLSCHYLPHRAVIKENSTTPIRPVFDASAKTRNNPSLNDCLEKGPNLLELIPSILIRLRLEPIGVIADIKKAFQQMCLTEPDRDFMRFLWWENVQDCKRIIEYRHARVVFGVSSSPFLLGATLRYHVDKFSSYEDTKKLLQRCLYVDNAVLSVPTMQAAQQFKTEACEILEAGKFELRGWEFGPCDEDKSVAVLGLIWNQKEDTLLFDLKKLLSNMGQPATKRNIYSLLNMLYDPLGFAAPFTVCGKILLKKVCLEEKIGWDQPVSEEHSVEFERWKKQFVDLEKISLPRHVFATQEGARLSLNCMCDASKDCFAACVYLRVDSGEEVKVFLIMCKTRISPKKGVTIPRLELLACLIGARLMQNVKEAMGMDIPCHFWTDSTTALTWIQREDSWATFVNNRVREIRQLSEPQQWSHVPGVLNPADLPSRGCSVRKLVESDWWSGPEWLYNKQYDWSQVAPNPDEMEVNQEKKMTIVSASNLKKNLNLDEAFLRCGSFTKLVRVVCYILRFTNKARNQLPSTRSITTEEAENAERYLIRYIQQSMEESTHKKLPIMKDEFGILRLKTRLAYGEDEECFKYPALIPGPHPIVKLLILRDHRISSHAGVLYLQSHLRERYWITNSRRSIRNVIHKCATCRRHLAKRCQVPESALPADRVNTTKCFSVTGIDLTGPLFVEKGKKVWIVLFTCAVYRAVHMELVTSLSTEAFLQALQKFVARRGRPATVYSDNGTNFTGASNFLKSVKWEDVQGYATLQKIRWVFNPPSAAWWGGWWERPIGLVKNILRRVIGSRFIRMAQMEVLIAEVESVMNDRPLTYVSDDPGDLRPLTPACFLRDLPVAAVPEVELADGKAFRMNLKKIQNLKAELRQRFRKEYLGHLISRGKGKRSVVLNPGAVVLVEVDNHKRIDWPMGIVTEVLPGEDEERRLVRVKTTKGIFLRPVQRLFPLEVNSIKPSSHPAAVEDPQQQQN